MGKSSCIFYEPVCHATWNLFAALGLRMISFGKSTIFLADEKEDYIQQTNDKTIPSILLYSQKMECLN